MKLNVKGATPAKVLVDLVAGNCMSIVPTVNVLRINNSKMNNKVPTEGTVILQSLLALSKSGVLHDVSVPLGFSVYNMETVAYMRKRMSFGLVFDFSGGILSKQKSFLVDGSEEIDMYHFVISCVAHGGRSLAVFERVTSTQTAEDITAFMAQFKLYERTHFKQAVMTPTYVVIDGGLNLFNGLVKHYLGLEVAFLMHFYLLDALGLSSDVDYINIEHFLLPRFTRCFYHLTTQVRDWTRVKLTCGSKIRWRIVALSVNLFRAVYACEDAVTAIATIVASLSIFCGNEIHFGSHSEVSYTLFRKEEILLALCWGNRMILGKVQDLLRGRNTFKEHCHGFTVATESTTEGTFLLFDFSESLKKMDALYLRFNKGDYKAAQRKFDANLKFGDEEEMRIYANRVIKFEIQRTRNDHGGLTSVAENVLHLPPLSEYLLNFVFKYFPLFVESLLKRDFRASLPGEIMFNQIKHHEHISKRNFLQYT